METLHHYFNRVEDEVIKGRLFANTEMKKLTWTASSMSDAIACAFHWWKSPEGSGYWDDIWQDYYDKEMIEKYSKKKNIQCETVEKLEIRPKAKRGRPKKKVA